MAMLDWPHYNSIDRNEGDYRIEVYDRDDELGQGRCISLYLEDLEVMRFDFFGRDPHLHEEPDGERIYLPKGDQQLAMCVQAIMQHHPEAHDLFIWASKQL